MPDVQPPGDSSKDETPNAQNSVADTDEGIEYACPRCGTRITREAEKCAGCGEPLSEAFYAVYRPEPSRAMRIIALAALMAVIAAPVLALLWWIRSK